MKTADATTTLKVTVSPKDKEEYWQFFSLMFQASVTAVLLAVGALSLVEVFVSPSLLSNRSYGSVPGSRLVLLVFYGLWYLLAKK